MAWFRAADQWINSSNAARAEQTATGLKLVSRFGSTLVNGVTEADLLVANCPVIAAAPGFYLLCGRRDGDGYELLRLPVVAWRVETMHGAACRACAVTAVASGNPDDVVGTQAPDGQVTDTAGTGYDSADAAFRAWRKARKREQEE